MGDSEAIRLKVLDAQLNYNLQLESKSALAIEDQFIDDMQTIFSSVPTGNNDIKLNYVLVDKWK